MKGQHKVLLVAATLLTAFMAVNGQILHSVDRMAEAIKRKTELADHVKKYVEEERKRLDELEATAQSWSLTRYANFTKQELEVEMSHPVRVYRFITEISKEIQALKESINLNHASVEFAQALRKLPGKRDLKDATNALTRLQQIYRGEADFTRPTADNTQDVLTANEVFDIAKMCLDEQDLFSALENFYRAKEMYEELGDLPNSMLTFDFFSYVMHQQGNVAHALNFTIELYDYYTALNEDDQDPSTIDRLASNKQLYIDQLGGEEPAMEQAMAITEDINNENPQEYTLYNQLCRGEQIESEAMETNLLTCYYDTKNDNPLLILAPAKVEEIHRATGLSFYHHVLTEGEISLLQTLAGEKFEDSAMVADEEQHEDPTVDVTDNAFSDNKVRSSNTGWIEDEESEIVKAISNRIGAILDLSTVSAEAFQVLSYGIGGFYLPHMDWSNNDDDFPGFDGNRIATWIFYLNDIKKGGATVFPDLGATVWPEKGGAAFWRNLYNNGTGNPLTLHAACPVLEGYKWASNKWFHSGGNEFHWPCGLDQNV